MDGNWQVQDETWSIRVDKNEENDYDIGQGLQYFFLTLRTP
jgi:hypothetical protein